MGIRNQDKKLNSNQNAPTVNLIEHGKENTKLNTKIKFRKI